MTTIQQMRELRASLPKGKKDPWGNCCLNKRVLLGKALKKNELGDLTVSEYAAVQEWLNYIAKTKRDTELANRQIARTIAKIAQP